MGSMSPKELTNPAFWPEIVLALWIVSSAAGTAAQSSHGSDAEASTPSQQNSQSIESAPSTPAGASTTTGRSGTFVAAPIPISSPALGSGVVPIAGYLFPMSSADKLSPTSVVGLAGLITDNGSRAFGLGAELYFKENSYRVKTVYFRGNLNYDLYGIGRAAGERDDRLPLKQTGQLYFGEFLRRIRWRFNLGPRFITGNSRITVRPSTDETIPPPPDVGIHTNLRALGLRLQRDTRPNRFYPTTGTSLDFTADFFSRALGSKYSYQSYNFVFNKYWSLVSKQVLAYNLFLCGTRGEPPFYGNCIYGTSNQLRGYTAGRYLDRYMAGTQVEYRVELPMRFGLVGFGGVGEVVPGTDQVFRINNFLPAAGAGVRFTLSTKYHLNLRVDAAKGKNNHTISMGVGEAF